MGRRLFDMADAADRSDSAGHQDNASPGFLLIEGGTLGGAATEAADDPAHIARFAHALLRIRRLRDSALPPGLFADPSWDMLLDLYVQSARGRLVTVKSACLAAHVPLTTALRWLELIEAEGLLARRSDPRDARRRLVVLTQRGEAILTRLLGAMEAQIVRRHRPRALHPRELAK